MAYLNYESLSEKAIENHALDLRAQGTREVAVIRGEQRGNCWSNKTYQVFSRAGWWKTGEEYTKDGVEYIGMKTR